MITGGTSGLGLELAKLFHSKGNFVYVIGRDLKGYNQPTERFRFIKADFSDLDQISQTIKMVSAEGIKFDMIINNAGVLSPPAFTETINGIEYSFQVNFLSHLLIDELIVSNLTASDSVLIISVTSPVYKIVTPDFKIPAREEYRMFKNYALSKYYLLLIASHLKEKYPDKSIRSFGFDPGTFGSGIYRMQKPWFRVLYTVAAPFMKRPSKVAKDLISVPVEGSIEGAVYKSRSKYKLMHPAKDSSVQEFLKECQSLLNNFI